MLDVQLGPILILIFLVEGGVHVEVGGNVEGGGDDCAPRELAFTLDSVDALIIYHTATEFFFNFFFYKLKKKSANIAI